MTTLQVFVPLIQDYSSFKRASSVFLLSLWAGSSFAEILNEYLIVSSANIIRFGRRHLSGQAHFKELHKTGGLSRNLAALIVLYEIAIWVVVILVGILYILTTEEVGNIVQAAVAISSINDIDNMAVVIIF
jgi:hypothetical protein